MCEGFLANVFIADQYLFKICRTKDLASPYPFQQSILFNARQPTIFLIDNGDFVWLWQGWWPQEDPEGNILLLNSSATQLILQLLSNQATQINQPIIVPEKSAGKPNVELQWKRLFCTAKQNRNRFHSLNNPAQSHHHHRRWTMLAHRMEMLVWTLLMIR